MLSSNEEQANAQNFVSEYNELCKKYGLQVTAQPVWVSTNHGTFEISIKLIINKLTNQINQ